MNQQDIQSQRSFNTQNFQSKVIGKKNVASIFPDDQLQIKKAYNKLHKNHKNQENLRAIKREKKLRLDQTYMEKRNYQEQGTEQSNIHTTFENYMNQIQGINNEDLGDPPSFLDMQNAQIFNAKTPFLELGSADNLISQKAKEKKTKKGTQSKISNYNLSKFSDLYQYKSNEEETPSPETLKKQRYKSAKASKRYIDQIISKKTQIDCQKQQNKAGLIRIANQTLNLNNNTNNNDILSQTIETNKNILSNQNDTVDYYEKTLNQLLNKDINKANKQNQLPPIEKPKLATIETSNSKNFKKSKNRGQNAGFVSTVSPRENQNSTKSRIFPKEELILSPLNNQYDLQYNQNTQDCDEEETKQLQLSKIEQVLQTARSSNQQFLIKKRRKDSSSSKNKFLSGPMIKLQKKLSNAVNMNQQAIAKNSTVSPTSQLDNYGYD